MGNRDAVDERPAAPATQSPAEPHPIRLAMEARDHPAMVATLGETPVLHSPVTPMPIVGREAVAALLLLLIEEYEEWRCVGEVAHERDHVLFIQARIGGREVQLADLMRHDERGRVVEMRLYGRPIASVAAFAKVIGPRIARRRGAVRALLVRLITIGIPTLLAVGDRVVSRLAFSPAPVKPGRDGGAATTEHRCLRTSYSGASRPRSVDRAGNQPSSQM
jgi:hypothetical protein